MTYVNGYTPRSYLEDARVGRDVLPVLLDQQHAAQALADVCRGVADVGEVSAQAWNEKVLLM